MTDPSEAGKRVEQGFVSVLRELPGFVAYYWIDAGGGVMISTSVFESRESAESSNKKAAAWAKENLASALPWPPQITAGEVVASSEPKQFGVASKSTRPSQGARPS